MGTTIIKPKSDEDFYVCWSSITESPYFWGTRAEMATYLESPTSRGMEREPWQVNIRLDRTDRTGTSALWGNPPREYAYEDDSGIIYEQRGTLRKDQLKELCRRLQDEDDVLDMLEPLEGRDEVGSW